ncbi:MAG: tRNA (adenosine(37)-N6)-dimethylallyltransferase MiaA [Sphingobacteriia bacterium]|nr:tRNA (adenosine(37)-N6)-dimethylallyltransferase MiaA [Sphingobacteriia bacterium]
MQLKDKIIIVGGPTTSGKTDYAINLAKKINAEIINADSQQVYSEIPILTAQPTSEEKQGIPHFLFGYKTLNNDHSVGIWLKEVIPVINEIIYRNKTPIIVGGTGMYLKALSDGINEIPDVSLEIKLEVHKQLEELGNAKFHEELQKIDPILANKIFPNDAQRMLRAMEVYVASGKPLSFFQSQPKKIFFPIDKFFKIKIIKPREELYQKCNDRFVKMWNSGVLEEAKYVLSQNYKPTAILKAHGLPQIIAYLKGEMLEEEVIKISQQITRNYVKRQFTWFTHQGGDYIENFEL